MHRGKPLTKLTTLRYNIEEACCSCVSMAFKVDNKLIVNSRYVLISSWFINKFHQLIEWHWLSSPFNQRCRCNGPRVFHAVALLSRCAVFTALTECLARERNIFSENIGLKYLCNKFVILILIWSHFRYRKHRWRFLFVSWKTSLQDFCNRRRHD